MFHFGRSNAEGYVSLSIAFTRRISAFKWVYPVEHEKRLKANKYEYVRIENLGVIASFLSLYNLFFMILVFF